MFGLLFLQKYWRHNISFSARNKLLKQSKVNQNEMLKKDHKKDRMNRRNLFGSRTYDNLSRLVHKIEQYAQPHNKSFYYCNMDPVFPKASK